MTDQHNSSQTTERRKKKFKNGGKWGQKITTAIFLPLMVKEAINEEDYKALQTYQRY